MIKQFIFLISLVINSNLTALPTLSGFLYRPIVSTQACAGNLLRGIISLCARTLGRSASLVTIATTAVYSIARGQVQRRIIEFANSKSRTNIGFDQYQGRSSIIFQETVEREKIQSQLLKSQRFSQNISELGELEGYQRRRILFQENELRESLKLTLKVRHDWERDRREHIARENLRHAQERAREDAGQEHLGAQGTQEVASEGFFIAQANKLPGVQEKTLKAVYWALALQFHPDKATGNKKEAEDQFKLVTAGYEVLCSKNSKETPFRAVAT